MALLDSPEFDYVPEQDKAFVHAYNDRMSALGYDYGGSIGSGYCWGRHMLIYRKTGLKTQNVVCRIYLREGGAVLRLFLKNIDAHKGYIEVAPRHVKAPFIDGHGRCNRCKESCAFRKAYTIDGEAIEKCGGVTFEFPDTGLDKLPDYVALFQEFYGPKKQGRAARV